MKPVALAGGRRAELGASRLSGTAALVLLAAIPGLAVLGLLGASTAESASSDPPVVNTRRALDHLGQAALDWQDRFQCSGCHKQAQTLAALETARRNGYEDARPGTVESLIGGLVDGQNGQGLDGCFPFNGGNSSTVGTTWGGRGLEAYDRAFDDDRRSDLLAAADCLLGRQAPDGSLVSDHTELPVAQGDFITTTHGIFIWTRAHELTGSGTYSDASERAVSWLRGKISAIEASPASFTTQDKAMLLAGLGRSGADPADPDVARMHDVLAAEQQPAGSWKLRSSSGGGNGHATGQAVFALRIAGYDRSDAAVDRGTTWLLDNQGADGSWPSNFWEGNSPSEIAPSMWGALALATYPSPLNGLRVSGGAATTVSWDSVEGASAYDVIRGDLSSLAELSDSVDLGPVACLAPATASMSVPDSTVPSPGQAFFYLMRIRWGSSHDIYGRSSGGRDRVPSSGDCPP